MLEGSRWFERSEYHRLCERKRSAPPRGARRSVIPSGSTRAGALCSGGAPLRDDLRLPSVIPSGSTRIGTLCSGGAALRGDLRLPSVIPSGSSRVGTLCSGGALLRGDLRLPSVIPSGSTRVGTLCFGGAPLNGDLRLPSVIPPGCATATTDPAGMPEGSRWFERSEYHRKRRRKRSVPPAGAHNDVRFLRDHRVLGRCVPEVRRCASTSGYRL
ncbi:hypothetical protein Poly24_22490 [Rosistilla carotiformis]|uniref:Uncharacterized protein n=1 Tax=Rosistilla carotiformis TaxID=2528017 RepID=A0A518JSL9_9BACT|nr:hypothetical protein Poly24_22490 [Rosistilla carotiformis]